MFDYRPTSTIITFVSNEKKNDQSIHQSIKPLLKTLTFCHFVQIYHIFQYIKHEKYSIYKLTCGLLSFLIYKMKTDLFLFSFSAIQLLATNEIVNMPTSKDTWTGQINHASITGQMGRTNKVNLNHRTQR